MLPMLLPRVLHAFERRYFFRGYVLEQPRAVSYMLERSDHDTQEQGAALPGGMPGFVQGFCWSAMPPSQSEVVPEHGGIS